MIGLPQNSLRMRLIVMLLPALSIMAILAGYWRYDRAHATTQELYDKTLAAVTLAISRHVVSSGGDLVAEDILEILTAYLGDQVFYKVTGPNGSFVTGYADGPRVPDKTIPKPGKLAFFDAVFQEDPVRGVIYKEYTDLQDVKGWVTVKVWQTTRQRNSFARRLVLQFAFMVACALVFVTAVIWFGVTIGLAPLRSLVDAVSKRSAEDLSAIRRPVPKEVRPLVSSFNALFEKLRLSFAARDALIANAAHQLRNPIAAVLSQAEAACKTTDPDEARKRIADVVQAARQSSRLSKQLLSLERTSGKSAREIIDLGQLAKSISARHGAGDHSYECVLRVRGARRAATGACRPNAADRGY